MRKLKVLSLLLVLSIFFILGLVLHLPGARAQEEVYVQVPELIEIVFRTELTSVTPVYAQNQQGNPEAIIGLNTFSNVNVISVPMMNGVLPHPNVDLGNSIGTATAEIRFPEGVFINKNLPSQIATGTGQLVLGGASISFAGTMIVRWVQDEAGNYTGVRWTDFSMGITETTGLLEGWKGHFVGTRLLIGDPDITFQSGISIFRLRKEQGS